jgi:hypothetical protein
LHGTFRAFEFDCPVGRMMDRKYARDIVHNFALFVAIIAGLLVLGFFLMVAFWGGQ